MKYNKYREQFKLSAPRVDWYVDTHEGIDASYNLQWFYSITFATVILILKVNPDWRGTMWPIVGRALNTQRKRRKAKENSQDG